jgi:hypothetical protein
MREEFKERECIQPVMMESTKNLTKEQMKKNIGGTAKTKLGTQTRSEGIPTIRQIYQKGKRAIERNQPTSSRRP